MDGEGFVGMEVVETTFGSVLPTVVLGVYEKN